MPELRKDPVIGRWVIIASERARRPSDFRRPHPPAAEGMCPFCPGNEGKTPPEILAFRAAGTQPNTPGWRLRVVPNLFPALMIEGQLERTGEGIYDKMTGIGAHEVIIESPSHEKGTGDLSEKEVEDVLWAYRERMVDLRRDERFRYVLVFKNQGSPAGASLEHAHSQLIALPIVPRYATEEMQGAKAYFDHKERCIYCDIVRQEKKDLVRVVYEDDGFISLAPWAPRSPFETWILPKEHAARFDDTPRAAMGALARVLRITLRKLDVALDRPPYNFILHSLPLDMKGSPSYHWHFEIMPTLTQVAGFEWGSGFYINPTPPEEAAAFLRKLEV